MSKINIDYHSLKDFIEKEITINLEKRLKIDGLYGYALLLMDPGNYQYMAVSVIYNTENDLLKYIKKSNYGYYRFSVDEWKHADYKCTRLTNKYFKEINSVFEKLHISDPDNFELDKDELRHTNKMYSAILSGFKSAISKNKENTMKNTDIFYALWIPDDDSDIPKKFIKQLNTSHIYKAFRKEFK